MAQCTHCGPVGENDGEVALTLTEISRPASAGVPLRVTCTVKAPPDERLYVALGPVLDCRAARPSLRGEFTRFDVRPGGSRTVTLSLPIASDLPAGVYPVWVPAVINGVLCAEARLIELPPAAPRS
jgi:hypothetical protein